MDGLIDRIISQQFSLRKGVIIMVLLSSIVVDSWRASRLVNSKYLIQKAFNSGSAAEKVFTLNIRNQHPIDNLIQFDSEKHAYTYNGQPLRNSVTQLVSRYFETFNAEEVAEKMMKGFNWPRPEYTHENGEPYTLQEILDKWNANSLTARTEGTMMHENIESILHGYPVPPESINPETKQFQQFFQEYMLKENIEPFRTEWRIAAPNIGLAGSVDFVGRLPDQSFILMDWKRTKHAPSFFEFEKNMIMVFEGNMRRAKPPITNLYDCDEMKYSLQLNFYYYILTNYYHLNISKMMICAFHPQLPHYYTFEAPKLQNEIHEVICDVILRQNEATRKIQSKGQ